MKNTCKFKLAAIDLDGTLLNRDKKISQANETAIRKLQNAGIKIVLASGRTHESLMHFQNQLSLEGAIISNHGAIVRHSKTNEIISFHHLPAAAATMLVEEAYMLGLTVIYCQPDGIFIKERNEWTDLFEQRAFRKVTLIDSFDALHDKSPYKIIWMHTPERLSSVQADVSERFERAYYIARGDAEHLEFLSIKANKAEGLRAVCESLAIDASETLAFGDADNDIPMLQWAGTSIAMNHATSGAKSAAKFIAPPGEEDSNFAQAVDFLFTSDACN